jgi:hypothetical protein
VALYFESSILAADLPLISAAAASVEHVGHPGDKLTVNSKLGVGVSWSGPVLVDSVPWPVSDDRTVWLSPGAHTIQAAPAAPPVRLLDLNAELKSARVTAAGIEFSYESSARAFARLNRPVRKIEIDGAEVQWQAQGDALLLPRGQHIVTVAVEP